MAIVTAILLFFSVGVYFFSKLYLEKRFFKRLQDRAVTTTTLLFDLQTADTTVLKLVNTADKELLSDESIYVYDETLKKLVFASQEPYSGLFEELIPNIQQQSKPTYYYAGFYQTLGIQLKKGTASYWVIVSAIDRNGKEALEDLRKILTVMVLIGLLLSGLSGWFFADKALAPMSGIITQVNEIFPILPKGVSNTQTAQTRLDAWLQPSTNCLTVSKKHLRCKKCLSPMFRTN